MIANLREPAQPRAKRRPSPRNSQIFEAVRVNGEKQAVVAARHGLSQRRVSAICAQVDEYQRWARSAPNADELAAEQRRRDLHQCRRRAEQLLTVALRQAAQSRQHLVSETRRIEGGQEVIVRTVQEVPVDVQWLKAAGNFCRDIVQINEQIGPDAESSLAMSDVDALLAAAAAEDEKKTGTEMESWTAPKEGSNCSRSSKDNRSLGPNGAYISGAQSVVNADATTSCVETGAVPTGVNRDEKNGLDKVFCAAQREAPMAESPPTQTAQTAKPKLPREVRERRARFLQSSPEPRADETRLVRSKPR